ncbi:hypothetical protein HMPREF1139_1939 [Campylobacter sp. FOBRC14]|nr:hypothetical protein HMPREF1139_1939 [Campylobacter sp. FOBRC14]
MIHSLIFLILWPVALIAGYKFAFFSVAKFEKMTDKKQ